MKKRIFIKNAAVLTVTALVLRCAGMLLRIYLSNTVGAEGMGLYQLIFSVYMLVSTFASAGLSTAVTRLCADELVCGSDTSVKRVMRRAAELTIIIGVAMNTAVYFFAKPVALYFIKDTRATNALKILSFSLTFMGLSSCFKGYFMARRKAIMPSSSQIFEQIVRIVAVIVMIGSFGKNGIEAACFAILCADTIAEASSCLYLFICYSIDKRKIPKSSKIQRKTKGITAKLLKIAAPIIAGKYLNSTLRTIENLLVPECLHKAGVSRGKALESFGELKGMALPLIFFPSSFLMSISTLLIPEISEAKALDNKCAICSAVSKTVCITMQLSLMISAVFALLSNRLGVLIYNSENVGFLIRVLAPLVPAMYIEAVCDGMLKGLNQQNYSLIFGVIDSILRITGIIVFVPRFGMAGFLAMMIFSNAFTSVANLSRLMRVSKTKFDFANWLIKPTLFAIISLVVTAGFLNCFVLSPISYSIIAIALICSIYFSLIFIFKCSNEIDIFKKYIHKKSASRKREAQNN